MGRRSLFSLFALALLASGLNASIAYGEGLPRAVVGVLDFAHIMRSSDAAKDVRRQIDEYRKGFRVEIQADEVRLRKVEADLKRHRGDFSEETYQAKRQEFRTQVQAAQRRGQGHKRQLDRAAKAAIAKIQGAVIPIVQKLTAAKGFNIIVDNNQVLFADRALDVTGEVMEELNRVMGTVDVPHPK